MTSSYLPLEAFRAAHGDPSGWSSAEFAAYLELSVAVAAVADEAEDDTVRTNSLLNCAAEAFGLDDDFAPQCLDVADERQLDLDFESVVISGLLSASYAAYPPAGHTYPKKG